MKVFYATTTVHWSDEDVHAIREGICEGEVRPAINGESSAVGEDERVFDRLQDARAWAADTGLRSVAIGQLTVLRKHIVPWLMTLADGMGTGPALRVRWLEVWPVMV